MKLLPLTAILLALGRGPVSAQQPNAPARPLRLSARVAAVQYCAGGAGVDFLHMRLQLRYENRGERRLILYTGNNLFFSVFVNSRPDQVETASSYELKTSTARFYSTGAEDLDRSEPTKDFVVLAPRGGHVTEISVSLPVAPGADERANGLIGAGEHLLLIRAATWYESRDLGERLSTLR